MEGERWVVEFHSLYIAAWYNCGPEYVSEEVAKLADKHVWSKSRFGYTRRVRRVR